MPDISWIATSDVDAVKNPRNQVYRIRTYTHTHTTTKHCKNTAFCFYAKTQQKQKKNEKNEKNEINFQTKQNKDKVLQQTLSLPHKLSLCHGKSYNNETVVPIVSFHLNDLILMFRCNPCFVKLLIKTSKHPQIRVC